MQGILYLLCGIFVGAAAVLLYRAIKKQFDQRESGRSRKLKRRLMDGEFKEYRSGGH